MSRRGPGRRPEPAPHDAFRAGLLGLAYDRGGAPPPIPQPRPAAGANAGLVLTTERLSGLAGARPAFECGRALRAILALLDRAGAPATVGRQFVDNLAAALIAHRARSPRGPAWGAEETAAMFAELYARVLDPEPGEADRLCRVLVDYARDEAAPLPGG